MVLHQSEVEHTREPTEAPNQSRHPAADERIDAVRNPESRVAAMKDWQPSQGSDQFDERPYIQTLPVLGLRLTPDLLMTQGKQLWNQRDILWIQ